MPTTMSDVYALWSLPITSLRWASNIMETMVGAQQIIAARMPTLAAAFQNPLAADRAELQLMLTEKVSAFGQSGRSLSLAGQALQRATRANARTAGKMTGGGLIWPDEWARLAETNLAAAVALATLPTATLAPIRRKVKANRRRLKTAR